MNKTLYRPLLTIIIALAVPIIPFAIIGEIPGERWLSANDNNALLFALSGASLLALDIVLPFPSSIIGTLLGARLGLAPGFFTVWCGLMAGHIVGYLIGRLTLARLHAELPQRPTLLFVFLSRPVPVLAEAMAIASGATSLPFTHYLLACALGDGIYAAVLAATGAALLPGEWFVIGLLLPMLLPVLAWFIWRASQRSSVPKLAAKEETDRG